MYWSSMSSNLSGSDHGSGGGAAACCSSFAEAATSAACASAAASLPYLICNYDVFLSGMLGVEVVEDVSPRGSIDRVLHMT